MSPTQSLFIIGSICAGLLAVPSSEVRAQSVKISFTTTEAGGKYAPANIVAVWAEQSDGTFIKTLGRWSNKRTQYLRAWDNAGGRTADAVSGSTRQNHNLQLTVNWDLTDKAGTALPQGVYQIRMELADRNSGNEAQNNQGTFMVNHNGTSMTDTPPNDSGFENVTIEYTAGAGGGGGDQCMDNDGTCPSGCTMSNDNDCTDGGGGDGDGDGSGGGGGDGSGGGGGGNFGENANGGCSAVAHGGGLGLSLLAAFGLLLIGYKRRRNN